MLSPFLNCPSKLSELDEYSPRVCKPYLTARVRIDPHIKTYYDAYGAPCIDFARPYVQTVNDCVYAPSIQVAKREYAKYGAPAWEKVQEYSEEKWENQIEPQVKVAKDRLDGIYKAKIEPYVQQALAKLKPYLDQISAHVSQVHDKHIFPAYAQSGPFVGKVYSSGQDILATKVYPCVGGAWSSSVHFVNYTLWPTITRLYSENVEPQLVKIGQKLASYKEGSRLWPAAEEEEKKEKEEEEEDESSKE